jgi:hypothetical protein
LFEQIGHPSWLFSSLLSDCISPTEVHWTYHCPPVGPTFIGSVLCVKCICYHWTSFILHHNPVSGNTIHFPPSHHLFFFHFSFIIHMSHNLFKKIFWNSPQAGLGPFFFFSVSTGVWTQCLQGRYSTTWATPPAPFCIGYFSR